MALQTPHIKQVSILHSEKQFCVIIFHLFWILSVLKFYAQKMCLTGPLKSTVKPV